MKNEIMTFFRKTDETGDDCAKQNTPDSDKYHTLTYEIKM